MKTYYIKASGCDDKTRVLLDLTDEESAAVTKVAKMITAASEFSCMPRLLIREASAEDHAELSGSDE